MKPSFLWNDAFLLNEQLSDDERAIVDAAHDFCQEKLQTRVLMAARHEKFDREIMNEFGSMGFLGCLGDRKKCGFILIDHDFHAVGLRSDELDH